MPIFAFVIHEVFLLLLRLLRRPFLLLHLYSRFDRILPCCILAQLRVEHLFVDPVALYSTFLGARPLLHLPYLRVVPALVEAPREHLVAVAAREAEHRQVVHVFVMELLRSTTIARMERKSPRAWPISQMCQRRRQVEAGWKR